MKNAWLFPRHKRVTHCSDHPPTHRQSRSSCPQLFTLPSEVPRVIFEDLPRSRRHAWNHKRGLPQAYAAERVLRQRWQGAAAARLAHPRVRSWLLAALRGAGAAGSAPAVSRGRPPPGAGPAAATLRTPPAWRQRQQLQPHCSSSYFSDGSSWCCLGKRFFPPARNRFPTFHQST